MLFVHIKICHTKLISRMNEQSVFICNCVLLTLWLNNVTFVISWTISHQNLHFNMIFYVKVNMCTNLSEYLSLNFKGQFFSFLNHIKHIQQFLNLYRKYHFCQKLQIESVNTQNYKFCFFYQHVNVQGHNNIWFNFNKQTPIMNGCLFELFFLRSSYGMDL